MLDFSRSTNLGREVKNLSKDYKRITELCFTLPKTFIRIERSILSYKFNQFCEDKVQIACAQLIELTLSLKLSPQLAYFPRNFNFDLVDCQ